MQIDRRNFLGTVGGLGTVVLAGSGEMEGQEPEAESPAPDLEPGEEPDVVTGEDGVDRYDVAVRDVFLGDLPGDLTFQSYATPLPEWNPTLHHVMIGRSYADDAFYGELAEDWSYEEQVLTVDLHDDFYYWDGGAIDAENVALNWELEEAFMRAAADADAHPAVDAIEIVDDYRLEFHMAEPYREDVAIEEAVLDYTLDGSTEYYQPWMEDFEDADDDDARISVAQSLQQERSADPDPFYYGPFRIVNTHDDAWDLRIRDDEDPVSHYVSDINYRWLQLMMALLPEGYRATKEHLMDEEELPFFDATTGDPGWGFETERVQLAGLEGEWSVVFNAREEPFADPRFRRAVTYFMNRELMMQTDLNVENRRQTPFIGEARSASHISEDVLDAFEEYGWDESDEDAAEAEMEAGGFERNADGQWTHDGDPIELTILLSPAQEFVRDHGDGFRRDATDWGLPVFFDGPTPEHTARINDSYEFEAAAARWGGASAVDALAGTFEPDADLRGGYPGLPDPIEAPPVGTQWPDADELEDYDVAANMATIRESPDDDERQTAIDELCWVYNQVCARIGIEGPTNAYDLNVERYDIDLPADSPEKWTQLPEHGLIVNGAVTYQT